MQHSTSRFMQRSLIRALCLFFALFALKESVAAAKERKSQERPNILFIAIDDLRNDLGVLGVEHAHTPNLDAFAAQSRLFSRHYIQVPSCGPSRAALLSGQWPDSAARLNNNAILNTLQDWQTPSLPAWFKEQGYFTLSLGKISHYPGGLAGENWDAPPEEMPGAWHKAWVPDSPWEHPLGMMHGYANGTPRTPGVSSPIEAYDGPDEAYPDAWVARDAIKVLHRLAPGDRAQAAARTSYSLAAEPAPSTRAHEVSAAEPAPSTRAHEVSAGSPAPSSRIDLPEPQDGQPWFFAVGFFKPHLPFAAPQAWFDVHDADAVAVPVDTARPPAPSHWHGSGEMFGNYGHPEGARTDPEWHKQLRHAYAAATSYVDEQVGRVLRAVEELGLAENTIIVIWSDHGFALGEQGIWGKHSLYEAALKAPLFIRYPGMPEPGPISPAIVETIDIYPTLTDLAGVPAPEGLHGHSLRPMLDDPMESSLKPAYGFWGNGLISVRDERFRLIVRQREPGVFTHRELYGFGHSAEGVRLEARAWEPEIEQLLRHFEYLPSVP